MPASLVPVDPVTYLEKAKQESRSSAAVTEPVSPSTIGERQWLASIALQFSAREDKTVLLQAKHQGPLRVQRPFYPEGPACCHIYLLHPPGGMVIGDRLLISAELAENTQALITTPSAGKIYGAKGSAIVQSQQVEFSLAENTVLEWLPQETIVFNGARGRLQTRVHLQSNSCYAGWDIVRLGRAASGERFVQGECLQSLEVYRSGRPLFIERNRIVAGSKLQASVWGLNNKNTLGTFIVTVSLSRTDIDELIESVEALSGCVASDWSMTQKNDVFIARYLGDDVSFCRRGFEHIWNSLRPAFKSSAAVRPRIWNT